MKRIAIVLTALCLSACASSYPTSSIGQGSQNARVRVTAGGIGAQVLIDGKQAGVRSDKAFDVFETSPGRHSVAVTEAGRSIVDKQYFIDGGATVEVGISR
jgi:uncharacterized lipoprotein YmbA